MGDGAEVADALQLILGQLDAEMVFKARQEAERLQAVYAKRLEKIVVGRKLLARHFEMRSREVQDFVECGIE